MSQSTIQRATGRWPEILTALGIDKNYLRNTHGPCPISGGSDRFRFDDKNGTGSWYCGALDPQAGYGIHLAMLWTGKSMPEVSREIDDIIGRDPVDIPAPKVRDPRPALRDVARRAQLVADAITPVRQYLHKRCLSPAPQTRYVASQAYWQDGAIASQLPCMAHLVVDKDGLPATWHLTYLTNRGDKADVPCPRKIMTPSRDWKGGAVRLWDLDSSDKIMGIAEGIETALAGHQLWAGLKVWSALNANNLAAWEPPQGLEQVVIFADNDASFTGQAAAYELARRLSVKNKLNVTVCVPEEIGTDWNDDLMELRT
jgi:putative DNA primase/helicase